MDLLRRLGPLQDENAARRAFDATLRALRRGLDDDEADWLAIDLGPRLAAPLLREAYSGELSPREFYRWAGRFSGLRRSVAKEQAQVVCRALSQLLSQATLARLRAGLPELAPLFPMPEAPPANALASAERFPGRFPMPPSSSGNAEPRG
jgi:uncharacterized protein (DUF2267 family)